MLYRAEAIILRTQPFAEADRLVTLLTQEGEKLRAVAKGTRRTQSRLGGAVQPFVRARFLLWKGRSLDGISQAEVVEAHRALREDPVRLGGAAFLTELVDAFTQEGEANPALFDLLARGLQGLAGGATPMERAARDRILRACEAGVLAACGYRPSVERCAACGGPVEGGAGFSPEQGGALCRACAGGARLHLGAEALAVLRRLLEGDPLRAAARLRWSAGAEAELRAALGGFAVWILQRPLKSAAFLDIL
ncbi:MAG: DNA repair protein RecO [Firmicutes bacterium]|nr:DNA repair protein RecO [Bacillota bacterium]